jgi:putative ABC transport system permease protein
LVFTLGKESLKIAFHNIRERKLRSFLTVLAIFIGIAAVISLVSITQGMQEAISEQFERMGTNKIMIMPGGGEGLEAMGMMLGAAPLTEDEAEEVEKVNGVDIVLSFLLKTEKVEFKKDVAYTYVRGTTTDEALELLTEIAEIEQGKNLKEGDKYKALIGNKVGELFDREVTIGSKLEIKDESFEVVGIFKEIGAPDDDYAIYIPMETAREIFEEPTEVSMIYLQIKNGFDPLDVAESIKKRLRDTRDEKAGEETFQVFTSEQLSEQVGVILGIISIVLIGIASISLLVGGVGIANTMYTSVLERTKEIGVMKAIGARNYDILIIFLIESGLLGLIGGVIGCFFGIGIAKGIEIYAAQAGMGMLQASITPQLILFGLGFSFLVGCISGLLPARKGSKLQPVEALRYE